MPIGDPSLGQLVALRPATGGRTVLTRITAIGRPRPYSGHLPLRLTVIRQSTCGCYLPGQHIEVASTDPDIAALPLPARRRRARSPLPPASGRTP
ncbi:hypothetical protein GCM10010156_49400 [Planobispora rosea]|uniref:Uncharacterized protein n=1 Tax=Planobispora rosea TaxID=35762 RepID=A0A8J3S5Q5_PLARO|nr:hypothetical protein [Planobispora rosea]GGS84906.1 hypothetical protein GCM10010156_49400 [Planobispora rosea]GIH86451.1 hypothetical protein Pro02_48590 [Planobispora rosea]